MNLRNVIDPLDLRAFPTLVDHVNRIALNLGLLPFQGAEVRLEDDYGVIAQKYVHIARATLVRGWWFNTWERYKFTPDDIAVSDTPYYEISPDDGYPIQVRPIRFADKDCPQNVIVRPEPAISDGVMGTPIIQVLDEDWDLDAEWYATVFVIPTNLDVYPMAFTEYVIAKATQELAPYFGAATDPQEQYRTWNELLRAHADSHPAHNMIDDNPINWMTTRRR